ncbi:hypothetical protein CEB3_c46380 [Peptococcaceae bacterium CEB3]|nr:hypothetical protein CEB3_c46380 [Peptococcaceae bacterium CEB3]
MRHHKPKRDWSEILVKISTVVFACTALVTVFITISSWRVQREAARPYLTFRESPTVTLDKGVNLELKFTNVGQHPATDLWSRALVIDRSFRGSPVYAKEHTIVNDIPKDTTSTLLISIAPRSLSPNAGSIAPHYLVVFFKYSDPIIKKSYAQAIYLKWNGEANGQPESLYHVETGEKDKILAYLKTYKISVP